MRKRGSLSLSVNAIVVFVLAFAMLGVGLYFTNMLRGSLGEGLTKAVSMDDLKTPPTTDRPLTFGSDEIDIKRKDNIKMDVGFYNNGNDDATNAKVGISECISADEGLTMPKPPRVSSTSQTVAPAEGVGFMVTIKLPTESEYSYDPGTYICTLISYNSDGGNPSDDSISSDYIYESKQFFLNVKA